jgi:hypothetical protein
MAEPEVYMDEPEVYVFGLSLANGPGCHGWA